MTISKVNVSYFLRFIYTVDMAFFIFQHNHCGEFVIKRLYVDVFGHAFAIRQCQIKHYVFGLSICRVCCVVCLSIPSFVRTPDRSWYHDMSQLDWLIELRYLHPTQH